ncbi:peptidoglycan-binding domain-containing protein [Streptomyces sp. NPDC005813]|uniref:peptidoglycan-binding domain-containing protein n=1 Tax=Streptomyces sp. NPDC005813 TaxID=3155592 RepID=UPI0033FF7161
MRGSRWVTLGTTLCTAAALGLALPHGAVAAPADCSYTPSTYRPTLTYGDTGPAVEQAQCLSNVWGGEPPKLALDGVFDSAMVKKIEWIQGCHGLPPSGVIEGRTWHVLYRPALDCYDPYKG